MRENLIKEKHSGGMVGHFDLRPFPLLVNIIFWPQLLEDVKKFVQCC